MGPPILLPFSSVVWYTILSTTSAYFVIMPKKALTHIQNSAPGPPAASAVPTPAMLPTPMAVSYTHLAALKRLADEMSQDRE